MGTPPPIPSFFTRSGIGTTAPAEVVVAIARHVYATCGSRGLVAMCGTCRLWRQLLLEDTRSDLFRSMRFFRFEHTSVPLVMYNLSHNISRPGREICTNPHMSVSPSLQAELVKPNLPWTFLPADFPVSAADAAQAVLCDHPGTVLVSLRPATKLAKGAVWAPGDHTDVPVDVESPLFGGNLCAFTSQHGNNPAVYNQTSVHKPAAIQLNQGIRSWTVVLQAPVAEAIPTSPTKAAPASEMHMIISSSWFRTVDPGSISTGVFFFCKAANDVTASSKKFLTPDGKAVSIRTEFARFLAIFVLETADAPQAERRAACEAELRRNRPWISSSTWTLCHTGGAFYLWLKPRVVGSMPILDISRVETVPAVFDLDKVGSGRRIALSVRRLLGPRSRSPAAYTSGNMVATLPIGWRTSAQPGRACTTLTEFCRINWNLETVGRRFRDRYATQMNGSDKDLLEEIPHNRRIVRPSIRDLFTTFYLHELRYRLTSRLTSSTVGFATLFGASAFLLHIRRQHTISADPCVLVARDSLALKASTKKSIDGVLGHKLREGGLPGDLGARQNHRQRLRVFFDPENILFGRPAMLNFLAGQTAAAIRAVVPEDEHHMAEFPVWQRLAQEPDLPSGTMAGLIQTCRRIAETMAPLGERVTVIFAKPSVDNPNIIGVETRRHVFDTPDPAWADQPTEPPEDGIRVTEDSRDPPADPSATPLGEDVPTAYKLWAELRCFSVQVHHVLKNPDGDDILFGTVLDRDGEALCASDVLAHIWPPELGIDADHSITTTGLCVMAADFVAHRLLKSGRVNAVGPELTGLVAHMALVLSFPENGTMWQKQYSTYARKGSERYDRGVSLTRTAQSQPGAATPPRHTRRHAHALNVLVPAQLRMQTGVRDLAPHLSHFMSDLVARIEANLEGGTAEGWVWALARHYFAKVSKAFDLWAPSPQVYYNRVSLLAAQVEARLNRLRETADAAAAI